MTRKTKYIPHLADFFFKPTEDWTVFTAARMYEDSSSPKKDMILYKDCIKGLERIDSDSVDLIIADPPFGLTFNGKENIYNRNSNLVKEGYKEIEQQASFMSE